jgi:hypothetical protein
MTKDFAPFIYVKARLDTFVEPLFAFHILRYFRKFSYSCRCKNFYDRPPIYIGKIFISKNISVETEIKKLKIYSSDNSRLNTLPSSRLTLGEFFEKSIPSSKLALPFDKVFFVALIALQSTIPLTLHNIFFTSH